MNNARAFARAFGLGLTILAAAGCNAIFGLEEAELGDPFGRDASAGAGGTSQGGASGEAGNSQGGASGQGGANQGGANQGGANQGGANQGGASGEGGNSQGGASGQGGANQGGASGEGGASQGGASGQGGINQGGASGAGANAGSGGVAGSGGSGPTCVDKQKNGTETDIDCGGANSCPRCEVGSACVDATDCSSGYCQGQLCVEATCTDGVKNGFETDKDCGGGSCAPCGVGKFCKVSTDCLELVCNTICFPPECGDGVKNGNETDTDCGGSCQADCDDGGLCKLAEDCKSKVCKNGQCASPACNDNVKNGNESDLDCGAVCPGKLCQDNWSCGGNADCLSGVCTNGSCASSSCSDGVKNGAEADVDCGGTTCPQRCATDKACATDSDCVDGVCSSNKCAAPVCGDWVKNGAEFCDLGAPNNGTYNSGCSADCMSIGPRCGDGVLQSSNEQCDGQSTLGSCATYDPSKPAGTPTCNSGCKIDTSTCKTCDFGSLYTGWSGTQQSNGLSYLCTGSVGKVTPMTYDAAADKWSYASGCYLKRAPAGYIPTRTGQEEAMFEGATADPSSNALHMPTIAWKIPATLPVQVDLVARASGACGDGITARIWLNQNLVSSQGLLNAFRTISAKLTTASAGDEVRVEFDPGSTNACDTFWIKSLTFAQQAGNACTQCNQGVQLPGKLCLPTAPSYILNLGYSPHTTRVADVDGDRKPDLVVSGVDGVQVFAGNGDGTVVNKGSSAGKCGATRELEFIKLGANVLTDLVAVCNGGFETALNQGAGAFGFDKNFTLAGAGPIEVGSLNGDEFADVVIGAGGVVDPIHVCLGSATGTFNCTSVSGSGSGNVRSMFLAHFNGDDRLDLAATTAVADEVLIFTANTDYSFAAPVSNAAGLTLGLAADFNQDGIDDVVAVNPANNGFQVFKGSASAYLPSSGEFAGALQGVPGAMVKADLNVDGLPDFLSTEGNVVAHGLAEAFIAKQAGMISFDLSWTSSLSTNPSRSFSVSTGDLNRDGAPDVVVTLFEDKQVRVFLSKP